MSPRADAAGAAAVPRLLDAVYLGCIWVSGAAIFLMTLIIPWGIFARYVLGSGSQWPEPIAILLMVVFTFIGAAASYRAGAHIAVAVLTDRLPAATRKPLQVVIHVLMVAVCCFMVVWGTKLCVQTWGQNISELPWLPVGLTYSPVPIGGALTLLFVLEHLFFGSQAERPAVRFDQQLEESGEAA
jgi:TRAP-type C4-dicarboxylate transport system permease small subunit